jgi:hypothetical protein
MKRRILLLAGMLVGSWSSAQATASQAPTAPPTAMPEPSSLAEMGMGLSAVLGYAWWRVSRRKRSDS